jgi:hypothetical protein
MRKVRRNLRKTLTALSAEQLATVGRYHAFCMTAWKTRPVLCCMSAFRYSVQYEPRNKVSRLGQTLGKHTRTCHIASSFYIQMVSSVHHIQYVGQKGHCKPYIHDVSFVGSLATLSG